jgi:acetolactate synthase I/II/III large subunit
MKLSDYVIKFIADAGVKHIFMLAGGGSMHLVDSVGRCKDVEYICNLHEQACAIAADAYAQYTNNLGVSLVTTGPGGTNAVTGVAGAWCDSTPCLFISGQVKRQDMIGSRGVRQMGFQEIDIIKIVNSITKYAVTVTEPETIKYHLEKSVYLAKTGRPGPVWLDIPLDVQSASINEGLLKGFNNPAEIEQPLDTDLLKNQVNSAIQLINQAERPVILVGNGVRLAKGIENFRTAAEILQIPVLTTWKAMDFLPEEHPLFAGRPGASGQRSANFAQQNSDCIIVLGARLDLGQTAYNHPNFARVANKIIVDIDEAEIKKLDMLVALPVCADVGSFLRELLAQKNALLNKDRSSWLSRCEHWKKRYPVILPEYWDEKNGVNNYVLIDVLSDEMQANDLLIPGSSGACSEITMQAFRVKKGMRIFNSQGLGSMGFGVPASIGGCIASNGKRTVCIDGDGGFQMNIQELETVRRLDLPIKFFVLNNNGYGSIRSTQQAYFERRFVGSEASSGLTLADTAKIAAAYDLPFVSITSHADMRQKVKQILETPGPVVCEVDITENQYTAPRVSSSKKADGTMESKLMEDLWPFLDREEFESNMISNLSPQFPQ